MSRRWSNASWQLWSRPVDHYHVYFHGLLYRATITWHRKEEEEIIGWYEPGWPRTRTKEVWYTQRRYKLVIGRTAYRRLPHHEKKIVTPEESQRREWRQRESDCRTHRSCFCRRGPGRWFKKQTTRANRRFVARCLAHERWDSVDRKYGKKRMGYWN